MELKLKHSWEYYIHKNHMEKKLIIAFETREKDNKNNYYLENHSRH